MESPICIWLIAVWGSTYKSIPDALYALVDLKIYSNHITYKTALLFWLLYVYLYL